jgi:hypothetical protein
LWPLALRPPLVFLFIKRLERNEKLKEKAGTKPQREMKSSEIKQGEKLREK